MSLGEKLRKLRKVRGLTLEEVARESGITAGCLSQIERDLTSPAVSTLKGIADFYGIAIGYFFDQNAESAFVIKRAHRKKLTVGSGITYYLLSKQTSPSLEVLYCILEPGASTGPELHSHAGEECGIVLKGTLQIELGDSVYLLEEGDSISHASTIPHRQINIGKEKVETIWINHPPTF